MNMEVFGAYMQNWICKIGGKMGAFRYNYTWILDIHIVTSYTKCMYIYEYTKPNDGIRKYILKL